MSAFLDKLDAMNFPTVAPLVLPESVRLLADRLGMTVELTCLDAPEQYEITANGAPSGHIRARWGSMSVDYPDAADADLYDGPVDGFSGFTDHERERQLLLALGLIATRMMKS